MKPDFVSVAVEVQKNPVGRTLPATNVWQSWQWHKSTIRNNCVKKVKQLDWFEFGETPEEKKLKKII